MTLTANHPGLDPNRYRTTAVGEADERNFGTLDSLMSDEERFKDTDPFVARCRSCRNDVTFAPIADRKVCPSILNNPAAC